MLNPTKPARSEPIRILIADGDPMVGRAFVHLLQDAVDVEVVATAADEGAAIGLAVQLEPAVALVEAGTAHLDGMRLTRRLCREVPSMRIIVLSVYATFREQALATGACRFLLKDCGREELVEAILLVADGQCQVNGKGEGEGKGNA